jgi:hypothetical protein
VFREPYGSGLTSLNASNLASGTVPSTRLSLAASDIPSLDASKITTGTLTRPISTTTGIFSGDVVTGSNVYVGTNTNNETAKTIYFGGTVSDNDYNHCVIENRVWSTGTEKRELLLFSGNDPETTAGPDRIRLKGANILFDTYTGATTARTTESTKMIIRADGDVGIGTTDPVHPLDVNGTARATQLYSTGLVRTTHVSLGTARYPTLGGNWLTIQSPTYDGAIGDNHPDPDGGILFTNTSSSGAFPWGYYMGVVKDVATTNSTSLRFDIGKSNDLNSDTYTSGADTLTPYLTIDNGNVGIGTTSPTDQLDVHYPTPTYGSSVGTEEGSLTVSAGAEYSNAAVYFRTPFDAAAPAKMAIFSSGGGYSGANGGGLHFCLENTNDNTTKVNLNNSKMVVKADGDVGIGTTSPSYKLDVSGTGRFTGDLTVNGKIYNYNYTEVDINAPDVVSGTWSTANSSSWGDPKFNNTYDRYRWNDAPGYVEYTIPAGMKSAYLSQLQWSSGGYVDVHGVQSDGGLVFLRRINTRQAVENSNEGNPDQHDGQTITFAGSGLEHYSKIRLTNKLGRFHLDGLAFTPNENEGTEGTGMVHSGQISDLGTSTGIPTSTGTGANGTWGINITGSAGSATTATNQSGGTVSASTGSFSGNITLNTNKLVITTVGSDSTAGIMWNGPTDFNYSITRTGGGWTASNYQQLRIKWVTGMILDAGNGTYGRSYVGVNDRMSIGSSYYNSNTKPPDNGLLVEGNVGIGVTDPSTKLHVKGGNLKIENNGSDSIDNKIIFAETGFNDLFFIGTDLSGSGSYQQHLRFGFTTAGDSGITNSNTIMNIKGDGNVGIGSTNPVAKLDFAGTVANRIISLYGNGGNSATTTYYGFGVNSATLRYNVWSTSDVHKFYGGSTEYGYVNNGTGFISTFTGQHKSFPHESLFGKTPEDLCGLIVSASGEHISINDSVPQKGQGAIQVSEAIPTVKLSVSEKDKTVFGVVSDVEDMETSQRRDHYGAFVSTFEKELGDSRIYVNSIGEGAVWVTDINGPLESGDYITTSNVAGYGQKQDSEFLANYTVGKITMDCDFNPKTQPVQIIKKEMSNVNYWFNTVYENVSEEEYSNLDDSVRTTTTEIYYSNEDGEITTDKYNTLESNVQSTYTELTRIIYQKISTEESKTEQEGWTLGVRQELANALDEHGQLQWEDHPTETEKAYKTRYLTADGTQTDEANAVHIAAFVGCTYHCG